MQRQSDLFRALNDHVSDAAAMGSNRLLPSGKGKSSVFNTNASNV